MSGSCLSIVTLAPVCAGLGFQPSPIAAPSRQGGRRQGRLFRDDCGRRLSHRFSESLDIILVSTMILPQVHLRKPCYDFSFL